MVRSKFLSELILERRELVQPSPAHEITPMNSPPHERHCNKSWLIVAHRIYEPRNCMGNNNSPAPPNHFPDEPHSRDTNDFHAEQQPSPGCLIHFVVLSFASPRMQLLALIKAFPDCRQTVYESTRPNNEEKSGSPHK